MNDTPPNTISPIRPTDDDALGTAKELLGTARTASLAFIESDTGRPSLSRIAVMRAASGDMVSMVSELSAHTRSLQTNPASALLLGEPSGKGDPLNQPRLTLHCDAEFLTRDTPDEFAALQADYISALPKAKLYAGFLDFRFVVFKAQSASLNGGFGKAYELSREDILSTLPNAPNAP